MNQNKPRDWNLRFMFGFLLVALMVGIVAVKFWVWSVEERLANNITIQRDIVGDDKSRTNVLTIHENRLLRLEHNTIAIEDHWRLFHSWPTEQQIARANDE